MGQLRSGGNGVAAPGNASRKLAPTARIQVKRNGRQIICWLFIISFHVAVLATPELRAAQELEAKSNRSTAPIPLFKAIDKGEVEAQIIPQGFSKVTVTIRNLTERKLAIEMPYTFAATPDGDESSEGPADGGSATPQSLGGIFVERPHTLKSGRISPSEALRINLDPGDTARRQLASFCLEFGKPNPHEGVPYTLRKLESYTERPEIRAALTRFALGKYDQRATQAAIWHFTNGLDWAQLAKLRSQEGRTIYRFSSGQLRNAKKLVKEVSSAQQQDRRQN